jgi:hypothetical protein
MRCAVALLLVLAAGAAAADEADILRALVQRDQQSAEFAAGVYRIRLQPLHENQLLRLYGPVRPDERANMARERDAELLRLPPPAAATYSPMAPLPLPGGPRHGVDPIPVQRGGG